MRLMYVSTKQNEPAIIDILKNLFRTGPSLWDHVSTLSQGCTQT